MGAAPIRFLSEVEFQECKVLYRGLRGTSYTAVLSLSYDYRTSYFSIFSTVRCLFGFDAVILSCSVFISNPLEHFFSSAICLRVSFVALYIINQFTVLGL